MTRDTPQTLRAMLAESKNVTELMVDLAYGAVYFDDPGMATEVDRLGQNLATLVHRMPVVSVLAVRRVDEAEEMAPVLEVIGAIEEIGRDAVGLAGVAAQRVGIPRGLIAALSSCEVVLYRLRVGGGAPLAGRPLATLELPVQTGTWIIAVLRDSRWSTDVEGATVLIADDEVVARGPAAGVARVHELAGAPWAPPQPPAAATLTDVDHAVDVLVEMHEFSEVAISLAYAALLVADRSLAGQVHHLAGRLYDLKDRLQLWVLRAAATDPDLAGLQPLETTDGRRGCV